MILGSDRRLDINSINHTAVTDSNCNEVEVILKVIKEVTVSDYQKWCHENNAVIEAKILPHHKFYEVEILD